jgi:hypothetical protein
MRCGKSSCSHNWQARSVSNTPNRHSRYVRVYGSFFP